MDPETVELHFALGSLFRRRGEYDRAIRMHQHLLERADLAVEQRAVALFELGQDYLKAGIHNRAEAVSLKLSDAPQAGDYVSTVPTPVPALSSVSLASGVRAAHPGSGIRIRS